MNKFIVCIILCLFGYFSIACTVSSGQANTSYPCTPEVTENLAELCRVWGVLKYYHPQIAKGGLDWDNELILFLPRITRKNFNQEISQWISDLKLDQHLEVDTNVKSLDPELFQWITRKKLDRRLCEQLLRIVSAKQSKDSHYYVNFDQLSVPRFPNEKTYPDIKPWEDCNYRILTFFRIWNAIEYFYPYKNLMDQKWEIVLYEHLGDFVAASTEQEYFKALLRFTAKICDSHVNFYSSTCKPYKAVGLERGKQLPVILNYIEGKYVIGRLLTDNSDLQKGDIVTRIGKKNLDSMTVFLKPYISASNEDVFYSTLCMYFVGTEQDSVPVTVLRNGQEKTMKIASCEYNTFINLLEQGEAVRLINDSIGYVDISKLDSHSFQANILKLFLTKGLILDLREYPKEMLLYVLGNILMDKSTSFTKVYATYYGNLGIFKPKKDICVGWDNPGYYRGKVILLVNSATMSQGEFTAMAWELAPRAMAIGSRSAGTDGTITELPLPAGIRMVFTGTGICYPDGSQSQRCGVKIDEEVHPTIKGFCAGRDEVLERAIEIIKSKR